MGCNNYREGIEGIVNLELRVTISENLRLSEEKSGF